MTANHSKNGSAAPASGLFLCLLRLLVLILVPVREIWHALKDGRRDGVDIRGRHHGADGGRPRRQT